MSRIFCKVRPPLSVQQQLLPPTAWYDRHCSADPRMLEELGAELGDQIAIFQHFTSGLYTIAEVRPREDPRVIHIGDPVGRGLWNTSVFSGTCSRTVVEHEMLPEQAEFLGDYVEQLEASSDGAGILLCAPYGGRIHEYTDGQALMTAELLNARKCAAATWMCKGYPWQPHGASAAARWLVAPEELSERSFRYLAQIQQRKWWYAVLFMETVTLDITIGGGAPRELKQRLAAAIYAEIGQACPVTVSREGPWTASHPHHVVNRLAAAGGIQIAQPQWVLQNDWDAVARAVAAVLAEKL